MSQPEPADALLADIAADLAADVAVEIAGDGADVPGPRPAPSVRAAVLAAAREATSRLPWPDRAGVPEAARPLLAQATRMDDVLGGLDATGWAVEIVNGWTAAQMLAHLLAVDALCARALGLPLPAAVAAAVAGASDGSLGGIAETTQIAQAALAAEPSALRAAWRGQVIALVRQAMARGEVGLARGVTYLGIDLSAADVLVDRGFELWLHLEDLRAALGLAGEPPLPDDTRRMADLGVRILPLTWPKTGAPEPAAPLLVRLTGPGGGAWVLSPGGSVLACPDGQDGVAEVAAELRLDVVEFCRLAGGQAGEVAHEALGDAHLARAGLAATALARL